MRSLLIVAALIGVLAALPAAAAAGTRSCGSLGPFSVTLSWPRHTSQPASCATGMRVATAVVRTGSSHVLGWTCRLHKRGQVCRRGSAVLRVYLKKS